MMRISREASPVDLAPIEVVQGLKLRSGSLLWRGLLHRRYADRQLSHPDIRRAPGSMNLPMICVKSAWICRRRSCSTSATVKLAVRW